MAKETEAQILKIKPEDFGPLLKYVNDDDITDINLNRNGKELWITDLAKGKYLVEDHECDEEFVKLFVHRVSNHENAQFNAMYPVLESETGNLRISVVDSSVALSGTSICIRKSPPIIRLTKEKALEQKFIPEPALNLLINCVRAKMSFIFCGEPGVGKTECAKFFSQFISPEERVITIEDNPEFHYKEINPGKDCVEFKVNNLINHRGDEVFSYGTAIKTSLRQNPQWIMLSEARGPEVKYLLECWSTGVCGFTTLHTDDVAKVPDRIQNMLGSKRDADRLENDIFSFVDVGVLIRKKKMNDGIVYRYVDQVCFYVREGNKNRVVMMVEDGKMVKKTSEKDGQKKTAFQPIPSDVMKKLTFAGIRNPLECPEGV